MSDCDFEPSSLNVATSDADDSDEVIGAPACFDNIFVPDIMGSDCLVLTTNFNLQARSNAQVPYPKDKYRRKLWTDQQRAYAIQAHIPKDITDFTDMVSTNLDPRNVIHISYPHSTDFQVLR
jgi:hypothetical protein